MAVIDSVKELLTANWQWSDIGEAAFILGFEIDRNPESNEVKLSQSAYIQGLLEHFGMEAANAVTTPVENFSLTKAEAFDSDRATPSEIRAFNDRRSLYQSIVGSIIWFAVSTRPDLGFAAGYLSRLNGNPTDVHLKAAKRVLAYLKGSLALGLVFGMQHKDDNRLVGERYSLRRRSGFAAKHDGLCFQIQRIGPLLGFCQTSYSCHVDLRGRIYCACGGF